MAVGDREGLRVSRPVRDQMGWDACCLDDLLSPDHRARQVWAYVECCDLSALYGQIRSVEGGAGRAPTDPAVLMALWLYATLQSVGSARFLERLCESDAAYRWLCGGVGVNYHTLADFRVEAGALLDDLLTRSMAALAAAGIVDLDCLAVDGVRVRASAGTSSFRGAASLGGLHALAEQKVAALADELRSDPGAASKRSVARGLREAKSRAARIAAALAAAGAIAAERQAEAEKQRRRKPKNKKPPRGSTTDAEARVMSMADGGYRPAYNLQFKTDPKSGCVVGLSATNKASDRGQLIAAIEETQRRYGVTPGRVLADGGYNAKDDIEQAHQKKVAAFSPLPASTGKSDPAEPKPDDGEGVAAWRARMNSDEGAAIYARRFACERPHADARNRGLQRFPVRGLAKVKSVALWYVTAFNFLQIQRLAPKPA